MDIDKLEACENEDLQEIINFLESQNEDLAGQVDDLQDEIAELNAQLEAVEYGESLVAAEAADLFWDWHTQLDKLIRQLIYEDEDETVAFHHIEEIRDKVWSLWKEYHDR